MSLKAKIEAIVYASEQPVTLEQLTGALGLEAGRELDAQVSGQGDLLLEDATAATVADAPENGAPASEYVAGAGATEAIAAPEAPEATAADEAGRGEPERPESVADDSAGALDAAARRAQRERDRAVRAHIRAAVDALIAEYAAPERGIELREIAGGFRFGTKPEVHDAVRGFIRAKKQPLRLTLPALETLAVVAYKQPVTAPEVSEIRGVDSGGVLGSLLARKLIGTSGRKQVIGRPILYRTTPEFLLRFGLKNVAELPSIEEFEKMAGELAEPEEMGMTETPEERVTHEDLESERETTIPQADGDSGGLDTGPGQGPDGEMPTVDGRLSGLPPDDASSAASDPSADDPSAAEAVIQSGGAGGGR